jgi:hypothetical protein
MLKINPKAAIQASRITDQHTCVVVDDFLLNPEQLIEFAKHRENEFVMLERAYPGLILPVDNSLLDSLHRYIRKEMTRLLPFCRSGIDFHTQFSMATVQPEDFTWIQRLCHTDPRLAPDRVNYAGLLYLFDQPELGGTAFYRWKEPEFFEEMAAMQRDDPNAGLDILQQRYQMFRDPPCYMTDSNEAAELLDVVPARFNRFVFYSGDLPHNAYIKQSRLLTSDPVTGRLTLNCFISALPKN